MVRPSAVVALALVASSVTAYAQVGPAPVAPVAPVGLRLTPVTVSPELRTRFASKRRFDASKLPVTYRGDTPVMRVKNGRSYQLASNAEQVQAPTVTPPAVAEVDKRKAAIRAWRPGVRAAGLKVLGANHTSTQTPVKDQGPRGTCVAFSNLAGIEAWVKRNQNVTRDLSENHAHQLFLAVGGGTCDPDQGVGLKSMLALQTNGVCAEPLFPYTPACPASTPRPCGSSTERLRITSLYPLSFPGLPNEPQFDVHNTSMLEALLDAGHDIELSIQIAGSDWSDGTAETGTIDAQSNANGDPAGSVGNHGILVVGYNRAGDYFLFKNSWGTDWGQSGYGRLSYDYIETYARYGYAIVAVGQ